MPLCQAGSVNLHTQSCWPGLLISGIFFFSPPKSTSVTSFLVSLRLLGRMFLILVSVNLDKEDIYSKRAPGG